MLSHTNVSTAAKNLNVGKIKKIAKNLKNSCEDSGHSVSSRPKGGQVNTPAIEEMLKKFKQKDGMQTPRSFIKKRRCTQQSKVVKDSKKVATKESKKSNT